MANKQIRRETITIERRELVAMYQAIAAAAQAVKGGAFDLVYGLKRTKDALQAECDAIDEAQKPSEAFLAYDQARLELVRGFAVCENGEPVVNDRNAMTIDPDRAAEFQRALAALKAEHAEAIRAQDQRQRSFDAFLKAEVAVEVYRFPVALLPAKDVTVFARMAMLPLFTDAVAAANLDEADEPEPARRANGADAEA